MSSIAMDKVLRHSTPEHRVVDIMFMNIFGQKLSKEGERCRQVPDSVQIEWITARNHPTDSRLDTKFVAMLASNPF